MDAIYVRQSVEKADSLSVQGQIDLCKKQTSEEVKIYQDKGFSGKNTNRPAFQSMMEDVNAGLIQKIVVYRLDRFSRSLADFSNLWAVLQEHKVEFVSINETFDTTNPIGRAMLSIVMVFAQLERETTAERVRDNYYQRAKLGSWPGGSAPYGFDIGRLPDGTGRLVPALIPNDKLKIVEEVFHKYGQVGESLGSVAKWLNSQGIPSAKRPTWDNVALSRLLHSPLYVMADEDVYLYYKSRGTNCSNELPQFDGLHGGMLVGKRDRSAKKYTSLIDQTVSLALHFGVISSKLWLQCQYKLEQNEKLGGNGRGKITWLTGLLKCGSCGYAIRITRDKYKHYLACSRRTNLQLCKATTSVQLPDLELLVSNDITKLLSKCPDLPAPQPSDNQLSKELEDIDRKIDRLIDALAQSDDITMPYINRKIRELEDQRRKLLEEDSRRRNRPVPNMTRLDFENLDFEEKKIVAQQFIEKINLLGDDVEIIWRV